MEKYSFVINYRILKESKREKKILELAKLYNLQPTCRLIDRIIEDSKDIVIERKRKEAEIIDEERQIAEKKKRLYGGT